MTQVDATAKPRVTASDRADLLVVGASFAGVECAIGAARAGLRVTLIERKSDAGEKLHTTGIVVKEAADEIERLGHFPPELIRPIRGVRLYGSRLASVALDSPGYFFLATDTPNLMRWLIEQATNAGVDVHLGTLFTGARREAGGFGVDDIGRVRFIVGADGPTSKVARAFNLGVNRQFCSASRRRRRESHCRSLTACTAFSIAASRAVTSAGRSMASASRRSAWLPDSDARERRPSSMRFLKSSRKSLISHR